MHGTPDIADWLRRIGLPQYEDAFHQNAIDIDTLPELTEGDLVFFDYDGKKFSHVAVYLQNGYYVHASSSKGVIITKLHDPYTYKYFSRCGSIKQDTAYANSNDGK